MKTFICEVICLAAALLGQTKIDLRTQSKNVDFSQAPSSIPWVLGAALPANCVVGQAFFNTSAIAGANVFVCTFTNQWTIIGGNGNGPVVTFTTGNGPPQSNCAVGQNLYVDVVNLDLWFCEGTNTWKKSLTTTNVGPFLLTGQNGPGLTPALGNTSLFFNATAKVGQTLDDAGGLSTMVRPTDCSGGNQLMQKINADGTVACANGPTIIVGPQPACTVALRGTISETFSVAGQKDTIAVCLKDATDVFAWRTLY